MESWLQLFDRLFAQWVVAPIEAVLFFDVAFWDAGPGSVELPAVVLWLGLGALFFTLRFRFVNLRAFRHAVDCVRGRYTREGETGEISHFEALSAALSATVGLGNIAGVAVAVGVGGPGAVFWMIVAGFLGMSSKFAECTLGQRYRVVAETGRVAGGPFLYLRRGLAELGWPRLGRALAVLFCLMCIGGSFGGGNMFQSNQAYRIVANVVPFLGGSWGPVVFGGLLAFLVGLVIVGGIRRIGHVAAVLVPAMCAIYLGSGLLILALHADRVPGAVATIVAEAFSWEAGAGGFFGTLIQGFRRAGFSSEAGIGSAPIAHSAAATDEPVREGIVALLEPFVDTLVVCATTAIVIVVTGAHEDPEAGEGILLTAAAFATVLPWFPTVLSVCAVLFAFSTMISWSYYGEQSWFALFGVRSVLLFKLLFLGAAWAGAVLEPGSVIAFGDLMILGMAFPNVLGVVMLSGVVKAALEDYWGRLGRGEIRPTH